jgi:hypothetical protein
MNHNSVWLAAGVLGLTAILALAVLALMRTNQKAGSGEQKDGSADLLLSVPTGEVVVSILSVGLVAALTFTDALDVRVAGTLLGAHVGYHAAAAAKRR